MDTHGVLQEYLYRLPGYLLVFSEGGKAIIYLFGWLLGPNSL
jgi:hypothetical protein